MGSLKYFYRLFAGRQQIFCIVFFLILHGQFLLDITVIFCFVESRVHLPLRSTQGFQPLLLRTIMKTVVALFVEKLETFNIWRDLFPEYKVHNVFRRLPGRPRSSLCELLSEDIRPLLWLRNVLFAYLFRNLVQSILFRCLRNFGFIWKLKYRLILFYDVRFSTKWQMGEDFCILSNLEAIDFGSKGFPYLNLALKFFFLLAWHFYLVKS
jgi:hypothetical protein